MTSVGEPGTEAATPAVQFETTLLSELIDHLDAMVADRAVAPVAGRGRESQLAPSGRRSEARCHRDIHCQDGAE